MTVSTYDTIIRGNTTHTHWKTALVIILAIPFSLNAQMDTPPSHPVASTNVTFVYDSLSLAAAIQIAEENNRNLRTKINAVERSKYSRIIAKTEIYTPSLSANYTSTEDVDTSSGTVKLNYDGFAGVKIEPHLTLSDDGSSSSNKTTRWGISVSRPLLAINEHLRQDLPLNKAQRDYLKTIHLLDKARRSLRLEVVTAFTTAQRSAARLRVRLSRVGDSRDFLSITRKRVENGFAAPVDVVNATIDLNRAEAAQITEETSLENALDRLKQVLALPLDQKIKLRAFDSADVSVKKIDIQEDLVHLLAHHEDLVNQRLDIDIAHHEILIKRDEVRPQIDLTLSYEQDAANNDYFDSADDDGEFKAILAYETTLDFKRGIRAKLDQLRLDQHDRHLKLKDAEIAKAIDLRRNHRNIIQLHTRIALAETGFEAEQEKLKATIAKYERGNVDNLEVTRAKQSADNAEIELLDSRINLLSAVEKYHALLPARE